MSFLQRTWPWQGGIARKQENARRLPISHQRLTRVLNQSPRLFFDDSSRFIFFSDLHRGDGGPADAFRFNASLFLRALEHYAEEGYTYIEVGDGDELWKNRHIQEIRRAHEPIYHLMDRFRRAGRLYLLIGNHQMVPAKDMRNYQAQGILGGEGLLLQHRLSGQRILVTHGHQGDGTHAHFRGITRWLVRHIWRRLQARGMRTSLPEPETHHLEPLWVRMAIASSTRNQDQIEARIRAWLQEQDSLAIICGHTHRAAFAQPGEQPYFNCGSGVQPGYITGLEISQGEIRLVMWSNRPPEGPGAESLAVGDAYRRILHGPCPLASFVIP